MTTEDEFWAHVAIPDGDDPSVIVPCWPWTAGKNAEGYGILRLGQRVVYAHHVAHDSFYGPAPKGMVRRHTCNRKDCCNPFHLVAGTYSENLLDAYAAGARKRKAAA